MNLDEFEHCLNCEKDLLENIKNSKGRTKGKFRKWLEKFKEENSYHFLVRTSRLSWDGGLHPFCAAYHRFDFLREVCKRKEE